MFRVQRVVYLKDTDATGVLYFAQQFQMALEAFEDYLGVHCHSLFALISQKPYLMPVVHAEADFFVSLCVGDQITIELNLLHLGHRSFVLETHFMKGDGTKVGRTSITHVTVSKQTRASIPLPKELKECLRSLSNHS